MYYPRQVTVEGKEYTAFENKENDNFGRGTIEFYVEGVLDRCLCIEIQKKLGWHPAGYGFYRFRVEAGNTHWESSSNCD